MDVQALAIPEVKLITPPRFGDARGFFTETYNKQKLADAAGITDEFVQDNHSLSAPVGVLRGLHFQTPPTPQGKLVRCTAGRIFDVAVDIRVGSPTFGQWVGAELSADTGTQIWVPMGFAHAFVTLEPNTEVQYKVTGYYAPDCDAGLAWDDPDIGIDWPLDTATLTLSDKDTKHPRLADYASPFRYEG